jgi:ABC-type spermidine/putrescine transport system permease subunit II
VNKKARLAATYLGIMILLVVLFVYLPILVANASSIAEGLNYFVDTLAFSGAALVLADAISERTRPMGL